MKNRVAIAGTLTTAVAIGLARFAYPPIFPVMVADGWLSKGDAGVAGALNLAGYLSGVVCGRPLSRHLPTARLLGLGMWVCAIAFAACALQLGVAWFGGARFVAGFAGGVLMAVAGPAVQLETPPDERGRASGLTLAGIGLGATVAALVVPWLLDYSVRAAWLGIALVAVLAWGLARHSLPRAPLASAAAAAVPAAGLGLVVTYGLAGSGVTATFLYTVELAVRSRGMSATLATVSWVLFGAGAALGSYYGGKACDRFGSTTAIRTGVLIQLAGLGLILLSPPACHSTASFMLGVAGGGTVGCALACSREIAGSAAPVLWIRATAVYAVSQAATAFVLAAVYAHSGSADDVFIVSFVPTILAVIASFTMMRMRDNARLVRE